MLFDDPVARLERVTVPTHPRLDSHQSSSQVPQPDDLSLIFGFVDDDGDNDNDNDDGDDEIKSQDRMQGIPAVPPLVQPFSPSRAGITKKVTPDDDDHFQKFNIWPKIR